MSSSPSTGGAGPAAALAAAVLLAASPLAAQVQDRVDLQGTEANAHKETDPVIGTGTEAPEIEGKQSFEIDPVSPTPGAAIMEPDQRPGDDADGETEDTPKTTN